MATSKRRSFTEEERGKILADVPKLGVTGAARKHRVHQSCVSRWAADAGVKRGVKAAATKPHGGRSSAAVASASAAAPVVPAAAPAASVAASPRDGRVLRRSRVVRLYTPSQKAEVLEYAAAHSVTEAAKHFAISRFSIYDWRGKVAKAARGNGTSPTSGPAPTDIEAQRDREILDEWHKHPGLGPSQIVNQLRRRKIKVSVHTARRVMEDDGYRPPKVKREPHDQRYEAVRPNHLWHLDFVHRHINRASVFTLILIDDYSRYVVGHGVDEGAERADMVIKTFEEAVARHGRPERVMDDKGAAFWSWRGISRFTALLTEMGIDQVVAEKKEWNGKIEVFNANLHKELFDVQRFYDVAEMRRRLAAHLHWYNHARTHHALGGLLVPADRYYGRVDEVLARIEAGAGRDAQDLLDLRDRCLELFKVTSRGGVPEVWLLGQRLLGAASST
jgi:transposase InsO family protein